MREEWYGDKRDVVKWGTLVHLARDNGIQAIVQVALFRVSDRPRLESDGREWEIAEEVWSHFRSLRAILRLQRPCGLQIRVLDNRFEARERHTYLRKLVSMLAANRRRKVVLLDPDTGIAPGRKTGAHIGPEEITEVWRALSRGDGLVLYQHGRRAKSWRNAVRRQFARACRVARVLTFVSESASDVALFATAKR